MLKSLQFALKFSINIYCFDEEARECVFHFVENFSKNEQSMKLGFILTLICSANQWTGFYMITASVMKGLI